MSQIAQRFAALGDAHRLKIIEILARGPCTVGDMHEEFSMTLPGLLKHLRKLESAALIRTKKLGRVVTCYLDSRNLQEAEDWIRLQYRFWNESLSRLEGVLEDESES
ncbi:MAG: winged helix-turn-helix transcriptional regulator [Leptospiraceae bacterium]|nr:winged helix-turn-helix transcriptional regulator [Leptospiraceae bacterium]MCB1305567.1 winged helix-turn-helix transcriptional regulator [Leptospiraceae bacterium]